MKNIAHTCDIEFWETFVETPICKLCVILTVLMAVILRSRAKFWNVDTLIAHAIHGGV